MSESANEGDEYDLDLLLKDRRESQNRKARMRFRIVFGVGCVVMVLGAGLWIGNVTGRFVTVPLAGYITLTFGGFHCWVARQTWRDTHPT